MAEEAGFEIKRPGAEKGRFYPWPSSFRLGDTVLVEKVTGLTWPEFADRLPEEDNLPPGITEADDLVPIIGMIAASLWQAHPGWRRDKVASYVQALDLEHVVFVGGEEDDDGPPASPEAASTAGESTSTTSDPGLRTSSDSHSDEPSQSSSGEPTSRTSFPASPLSA